MTEELARVLLSVPAAASALIGATAAAGVGLAAVSGTTRPGSSSSATSTTSISAILTAAGIGPIPAPTPPFSPPLIPTQLAAFTAWQSELKLVAPKPNDAGDLAYQIAVVGSTEYQLPTGLPTGQPGSTLDVDGLRPSDGALIDAKNVGKPGCTPRTLAGLQNPDDPANKATGYLSPGDTLELVKYQRVLANPANSEARYLEIDTNDPEAVGYWQFLAAQQGVKTNVRYIP